jgi:hypothetical protein
VTPFEEPTVAGRDEALPRDVLLLRPHVESHRAPRGLGVAASVRIVRVEGVREGRVSRQGRDPSYLSGNPTYQDLAYRCQGGA